MGNQGLTEDTLNELIGQMEAGTVDLNGIPEIRDLIEKTVRTETIDQVQAYLRSHAPYAGYMADLKKFRADSANSARRSEAASQSVSSASRAVSAAKTNAIADISNAGKEYTDAFHIAQWQVYLQFGAGVALALAVFVVAALLLF